jgi:hypothetical protein
MKDEQLCCAFLAPCSVQRGLRPAARMLVSIRIAALFVVILRCIAYKSGPREQIAVHEFDY